MCIFIQIMNYQFPKARMLQMKVETKWASDFNLSLLKVLIGNRQRQTTVYPISSPRSFGSGGLKSLNSVQAYMMTTFIKSWPNRA